MVIEDTPGDKIILYSRILSFLSCCMRRPLLASLSFGKRVGAESEGRKCSYTDAALQRSNAREDILPAAACFRPPLSRPKGWIKGRGVDKSLINSSGQEGAELLNGQGLSNTVGIVMKGN